MLIRSAPTDNDNVPESIATDHNIKAKAQVGALCQLKLCLSLATATNGVVIYSAFLFLFLCFMHNFSLQIQ